MIKFYTRIKPDCVTIGLQRGVHPFINIRRKDLGMKTFKVFIFGLLYGWFAKIAFDRIYRDNEIEDIRNENAALKEYIRSLETKLQPKSLESKSVKRTTGRAEPIPTGSRKDDLKVILWHRTGDREKVEQRRHPYLCCPGTAYC
jgi:hypothetical protein